MSLQAATHLQLCRGPVTLRAGGQSHHVGNVLQAYFPYAPSVTLVAQIDPPPRPIAHLSGGSGRGMKRKRMACQQQRLAKSTAEPAGLVMGFAGGGRIAQKIVRDKYPPITYETTSVRLFVSVLNSMHFSTVTGLPPPPSPVSPQTYLDYGYPWYALFEENVPVANNADASGTGTLAQVKSVAQIDKARRDAGFASTAQEDCSYCSYQMATMCLSPCGHAVCDDCLAGIPEHACPACSQRVSRRERFAAAMVAPGQEEADGIDLSAGVTVDAQLDKRLVVLQRYKGTDTVVSFKEKKDDVSSLHGTSGGSEY